MFLQWSCIIHMIVYPLLIFVGCHGNQNAKIIKKYVKNYSSETIFSLRFRLHGIIQCISLYRFLAHQSQQRSLPYLPRPPPPRLLFSPQKGKIKQFWIWILCHPLYVHNFTPSSPAPAPPPPPIHTKEKKSK